MRLHNPFVLDLRSIALFRVSLGFLILFDLILRAKDLGIFYTDAGVLPRHHWIDITHRWYWSLHAANGEWWWQALLFALASLFAIALMLGYRSKLMAFLSYILLLSLLNRNVLLLQGGDILLIVMGFWSLFLPLGAHFSIDAALQPELQRTPNSQRFAKPDEHRYFSIATIAIVFQILYLYFFTALLKDGDAWRSNFDAAFNAVSLRHFATPMGEWITQFPGLLKLGTVYVLAVEFLAPFLVLAPFLWPNLRLIGLALLASLHVAFLLMLHIGLFPLIDFMALSLLIPGSVWAYLHTRRQSPEINGITIHYDEDCGFCLKMCLILREFLLPRTVPIVPAQNTAAVHAIMEKENSWVITDAAGKPYIHWHAMAFLFSRRWPFKPIGWLMSFPPFMAIGNRVYRWVANNRGLMGNVTSIALPYRALKLKPTLIGSALALLFFYVVTMFNVYELPAVRERMPSHVEHIARIGRIDQRWDMFAPYPITTSSFPAILGKLRSGAPANLYPKTTNSLTWKPPSNFYHLYDSYRWRKYYGRVNGHRNNVVRNALGDYLCRSWNYRGRPFQEQLATFEIQFISFRTNKDDRPQQRSSRTVWKHWCFPEYKPAS